jgi:hypothetical protein
VGGLSALGAGLYSVGIPKDSIVKYETQLKAERFLLIAHGTIEEVRRAKELLAETPAQELNIHSGNEALST